MNNDLSHAENIRRMVLQSIEPGEVRDEVLGRAASMNDELVRLRAALEEVADKFRLNELNYRGRVLALTARRALGRRQ